MKLASAMKDSVLVVSPEGDITLGNAGEVNDYVVRNLTADSRLVVLDMTKVDYVDSSAVGMIVALFSELQASGGALRLCGLTRDVLEIFKASSLDTILSIDATEEDALIAIQ